MVVMLGNPGTEFRNTRHNAGFMFCSAFLGDVSWQTKFHAKYIKQGDVVFLCPQTFMNESGVSVQPAAKFFGIESKDILVVHDDIEQEFGNVRIQRAGGMAGHNGLRSIKQHLGTDDFYRIRIGIGRPEHGDVANFVLGHFSELEQKILEDTFAKAGVLLKEWIEAEK